MYRLTFVWPALLGYIFRLDRKKNHHWKKILICNLQKIARGNPAGYNNILCRLYIFSPLRKRDRTRTYFILYIKAWYKASLGRNNFVCELRCYRVLGVRTRERERERKLFSFSVMSERTNERSGKIIFFIPLVSAVVKKKKKCCFSLSQLFIWIRRKTWKQGN